MIKYSFAPNLKSAAAMMGEMHLIYESRLCDSWIVDMMCRQKEYQFVRALHKIIMIIMNFVLKCRNIFAADCRQL